MGTPFFGPPVDSAAELRVYCAYALQDQGYPQISEVLAQLLADHEQAARVGAVRALSSSGRPEGAALLQFKMLIGDSSAEVMGECFTALLERTPTWALPRVSEVLKSGESEIALEAAFALGSCRQGGVVDALIDYAEHRVDPQNRGIAYTALALSRHDAAIDHLVQQTADKDESRAKEAIRVLSEVGNLNGIRERVAAQLKELNNAERQERQRAFRECFGEAGV